MAQGSSTSFSRDQLNMKNQHISIRLNTHIVIYKHNGFYPESIMAPTPSLPPPLLPSNVLQIYPLSLYPMGHCHPPNHCFAYLLLQLSPKRIPFCGCPTTHFHSNCKSTTIFPWLCDHPPLMLLRKGVSHGGWHSSASFFCHLVGLDKVHQGLRSLWNPQHDWEIFPMTNGFFIFLFTDAADCDRVLMDGP